MDSRPPLVIDIPATKPRPDDLTSYSIPPPKLSTFFTEERWAEDPVLICLTCSTPAQKEKEGGGDRIGCKTCGYTTIYPSKYFRSKQ